METEDTTDAARYRWLAERCVFAEYRNPKKPDEVYLIVRGGRHYTGATLTEAVDKARLGG